MVAVVAIAGGLFANRADEELRWSKGRARRAQVHHAYDDRARCFASKDRAEVSRSLGRGEFDAAAAVLGPLSEHYAETTYGSVEEFLRVAQEGYGTWEASTDRATTMVEIRPGEVVVVVRGTVQVEGNVEHRTDAFPARYAESAGAWFVEPWAIEPESTDTVIEVRRDDERDIQAVNLAAGTAWPAIDGGPLTSVEVGQDGVARLASCRNSRGGPQRPGRVHQRLRLPCPSDAVLVQSWVMREECPVHGVLLSSRSR